MAKSKYEYVKQYEVEDRCLLPNCWLVVRLDGKAFHRFTSEHGFLKPNDKRSLHLMSRAAAAVLEDFGEICVAYGHSDEFSFIFRREAQLYKRRGTKIATNVCSSFTSNYVFYWTKFFPDVQLLYPPTFDGRVVLYPTDKNLRDYLSWRQADCHINNLYNTVFWALVKQGQFSTSEAEAMLNGTVSSDKNEILFSRFGINYNDEPPLYRKGTLLIRSSLAREIAAFGVEPLEDDNHCGAGNHNAVVWRLSHGKNEIVALCVDIIKDDFWTSHPEVLCNS